MLNVPAAETATEDIRVRVDDPVAWKYRPTLTPAAGSLTPRYLPMSVPETVSVPPRTTCVAEAEALSEVSQVPATTSPSETWAAGCPVTPANRATSAPEYRSGPDAVHVPVDVTTPVPTCTGTLPVGVTKRPTLFPVRGVTSVPATRSSR